MLVRGFGEAFDGGAGDRGRSIGGADDGERVFCRLTEEGFGLAEFFENVVEHQSGGAQKVGGGDGAVEFAERFEVAKLEGDDAPIRLVGGAGGFLPHHFEAGQAGARVGEVVARRAADGVLHAQEKVFEVERLGDEIVRAQGETLGFVGAAVAFGGKDDGQVLEAGGLTEATAHGEAVDVREADVEQDEAGKFGTADVERRLAFVSHQHFVAVRREIELKHLGDVFVVFDNQQPGFGHSFCNNDTSAAM